MDDKSERKATSLVLKIHIFNYVVFFKNNKDKNQERI